MSDALRPRPPQTDPLLTPQNAVLALIDYQPEQYRRVHQCQMPRPAYLVYVLSMLCYRVILFVVPCDERVAYWHCNRQNQGGRHPDGPPFSCTVGWH